MRNPLLIPGVRSGNQPKIKNHRSPQRAKFLFTHTYKKGVCTMIGYHCDLAEQLDMLREFLKQSPVIEQVLQESQTLGLRDYYIGAGCICQTVWNLQTGRDPLYGISDIDFAYFDDTDLSYEAEDRVIRKVQEHFSQLPLALDVKNQARVHLWYQQHYGYNLKPYQSGRRLQHQSVYVCKMLASKCMHPLA